MARWKDFQGRGDWQYKRRRNVRVKEYSCPLLDADQHNPWADPARYWQANMIQKFCTG